MSLTYRVLSSGLCVIKVDGKTKVAAEKDHDKIFKRLAVFHDDYQYRHKRRAPRKLPGDGGRVRGLNFSHADLVRFLRVVNPNEVHPVFLRLVRLHASFFISFAGRDRQTLDHELRHYRFWASAAYRAKCANEWKKLSPELQTKLKQYLIKDYRYHPEVQLDEWQAYLTTEPMKYWHDVTKHKVDLTAINSARTALLRL